MNTGQAAAFLDEAGQLATRAERAEPGLVRWLGYLGFGRNVGNVCRLHHGVVTFLLWPDTKLERYIRRE